MSKLAFVVLWTLGAAFADWPTLTAKHLASALAFVGAGVALAKVLRA